jgi:hypothetical protein
MAYQRTTTRVIGLETIKVTIKAFKEQLLDEVSDNFEEWGSQVTEAMWERLKEIPRDPKWEDMPETESTNQVHFSGDEIYTSVEADDNTVELQIFYDDANTGDGEGAVSAADVFNIIEYGSKGSTKPNAHFFTSDDGGDSFRLIKGVVAKRPAKAAFPFRKYTIKEFAPQIRQSMREVAMSATREF